MSEVFKPPVIPNLHPEKCTLFLAGSIEMGNCEDWQTRVAKQLEDKDVAIFNPRRDDWDASWEQSIHNAQFRGQVEWELDHLEQADIILMYLDPATKSPISLMELGLYASKGIIVCCPDGFWRKGNVEVVCARNGVPIYSNLDDAVDMVKTLIDVWNN